MAYLLSGERSQTLRKPEIVRRHYSQSVPSENAATGIGHCETPDHMTLSTVMRGRLLCQPPPTGFDVPSTPRWQAPSFLVHALSEPPATRDSVVAAAIAGLFNQTECSVTHQNQAGNEAEHDETSAQRPRGLRPIRQVPVDRRQTTPHYAANTDCTPSRSARQTPAIQECRRESSHRR